VSTGKLAVSVRFTPGDSLCQLGVRSVVKLEVRELGVRLLQFIHKVRHSSLDNVQAMNTTEDSLAQDRVLLDNCPSTFSRTLGL
jgi:hypothetical protein